MKVQLIGGSELIAQGVSEIAHLRPVLAANANPATDPFAANATLRKDEWEFIDTRVNSVLRERLTIVDDLRSRGMIQPLSIGSILRRTERTGDMDDADVSYDGDTSPTEDRATFEHDVRPVPIIAKGFNVGWRQLDASRTRGEPLDVTNAEIATRKVRDKLEEIITVGIASGGPTGTGLPGLITAPNRITLDMATPWTTAGADPIGDVNAMIDVAYTNFLYGPFVLYLPKGYWAPVQMDMSAALGGGGTVILPRTILERIAAFADISAIRMLPTLPADNVVLVPMTRDVWDMSEAQVVTTVQWEKNPFVTQFRVLTIAGPHIKTLVTQAGVTINGIIHLRPHSS